jgi:hypothetical protein
MTPTVATKDLPAVAGHGVAGAVDGDRTAASVERLGGVGRFEARVLVLSAIGPFGYVGPVNTGTAHSQARIGYPVAR